MPKLFMNPLVNSHRDSEFVINVVAHSIQIKELLGSPHAHVTDRNIITDFGLNY